MPKFLIRSPAKGATQGAGQDVQAAKEPPIFEEQVKGATQGAGQDVQAAKEPHMSDEQIKGGGPGAGQDVQELPTLEEQIKGGGPGERRKQRIVWCRWSPKLPANICIAPRHCGIAAFEFVTVNCPVV